MRAVVTDETHKHKEASFFWCYCQLYFNEKKTATKKGVKKRESDKERALVMNFNLSRDFIMKIVFFYRKRIW